MYLATLILAVLLGFVQATVPIPRENGIWYPGKGCGVSTQIKYLQMIPEDPSELECTFIQNKNVNMFNKIRETDYFDVTLGQCYEYTNPIETAENVHHKPIETKEECMKLCLKDNACQFIEFYKPDKLCILVNQDPKTLEFKNSEGSWYATKECILLWNSHTMQYEV